MFAFVAILSFLGSIDAIQIFSNDPLSLQQPVWKSQSHSLQPSDLWSPELKNLPKPTNAWWQNLVLGGGTNRIYPLPYQVSSREDGLHVCYPGKNINTGFVMTTFIDNLIFGVTSGLMGRQVVAYDELSVTLRWQTSDGKIEVPLVRGMPYVTLYYENAVPTISTIHAILKINGESVQPGMEFTSQKFDFEMNNGQTWKIYLSMDSTIIFSGQQFTFQNPYSGYIRVAILTNSNMASIMDQYSNKIPIGGSIQATTNGNVASLELNYQTVGSGDLLMMSLPHHQELLDSSVMKNEIMFDSLKGQMIGVVGEKWTMEETLTDITWGAPRSIDSDKIEAIRDALKNDINKEIPPATGETYFIGKEMAAIAKLALIADELNENELANQFRNKLQQSIEPWLQNSGKLLYDQTWGGIVDPVGINDPGANFGMGYYNDHHFHFGYFVYAAAVLAKERPDFVQTYGSAIISLIRDYSNPALDSNDPHFTFMRNKDWFVGHSWAAGLYEFGDSRNQESTSESVNGWYAISLYGLAIGDERIRDLGRLALATEIRSSQMYWQITSSKNIYPSPFADRKVVGILWSTKVDYATFFGANTEFVHCIQMLPFTPISEELLPYEWIIEEYSVLSTAIGGASEGWKGFIYMAHAIIDKISAWNEVNTLNEFDNGNSKTNTLYWVATRP